MPTIFKVKWFGWCLLGEFWGFEGVDKGTGDRKKKNKGGDLWRKGRAVVAGASRRGLALERRAQDDSGKQATAGSSTRCARSG